VLAAVDEVDLRDRQDVRIGVQVPVQRLTRGGRRGSR
jgi:hypothetical protein